MSTARPSPDHRPAKPVLTIDQASGMAWWNSLSRSECEKRLEALRLKGCLSASAADAWEEEQRSWR